MLVMLLSVFDGTMLGKFPLEGNLTDVGPSV